MNSSRRVTRDDLADKERREIVIIEGYLPSPASAEEINTIIDAVLQETTGASPKDMGLIMKTVMARLAGQTVDGKYVSERVRARLQS